jgi:hypothetical protein
VRRSAPIFRVKLAASKVNGGGRLDPELLRRAPQQHRVAERLSRSG